MPCFLIKITHSAFSTNAIEFPAKMKDLRFLIRILVCIHRSSSYTEFVLDLNDSL